MTTSSKRMFLLSMASAATVCALAYTSGPCQTTYPACNPSAEGAQCNSGGLPGSISFGSPEPFALYYCGGNTSGRCGSNGSGTSCSELLYLAGTAETVSCGSTLLGYCFTGFSGQNPVYTGYDCAVQPCPDVPNRIVPNIVGNTVSCDKGYATCVQLTATATSSN